MCPTPDYPNDGYRTVIYTTTFNYPWSLSDQCGSAVIQAYSPVVILELLFSGFLQPALWWLCIDANGSHMVKWTLLAIGVFASIAVLCAETHDPKKLLCRTRIARFLAAIVALFIGKSLCPDRGGGSRVRSAGHTLSAHRHGLRKACWL